VKEVVCGALDSLTKLIAALHSLARPYLTVLVATLFNGICAWAVFTNKLQVIEYITAIGPTNGMIIGFWFGERAAQKGSKE
jgi:hypothetical protein